MSQTLSVRYTNVKLSINLHVNKAVISSTLQIPKAVWSTDRERGN